MKISFLDLLSLRKELDAKWKKRIDELVYNEIILFFQAVPNVDKEKRIEGWIKDCEKKLKYWFPSIPSFGLDKTEKLVFDIEFDMFIENLEWIYFSKLKIALSDSEGFYGNGVGLIEKIELKDE